MLNILPYDVCFIFFGDVRYDSRLQNIVRSLSSAGRSVIIVQASDATDDFVFERARVISLRVDPSIQGFFRFALFYWNVVPRAMRITARYYCAEDLYSLPIAATAALQRKAALRYDSREIYSALSSLARKKVKQSVWTAVERLFIGRAVVFTSGDIDSLHISELHNIRTPEVIYNYPYCREITRNDSLRIKYQLPCDTVILIYQGMLAPGRGIFHMLDVLRLLDARYVLVLIGDGILSDAMREKAQSDECRGRLFVMDRVPHDQLLHYTAAADIGLSLIENISRSYFAALPNKLFEYIMCGTPPVVSDLPAMKKIIDDYRTGKSVPIDDPARIALAVREVHDEIAAYRKACSSASRILNWQNQEAKLLGLFR